jgi:hypothetical protein
LTGTVEGAEEVAQLVEGPTEGAGRPWALEPSHRTVARFDPAMMLLEMQSINRSPSPATYTAIARNQTDQNGPSADRTPQPPEDI